MMKLKWVAPDHVAGVPAEVHRIPPRDLTAEMIREAGYEVEQLLKTGLWELVQDEPQEPQAKSEE